MAEKWEGEGALAAEKGKRAVAVAKRDAAVVAEVGKGAVPPTAGMGKVPMAAPGSKTIRVKTYDRKIIELLEEEAKLFKTIEYCKKHVAANDGDADDVAGWNEAFVGGLDDDGLYDLMLAAHYLDLKALLDLTCKVFADKVKSAKAPEQIRTILNIASDFTPAEEAEIREELAWHPGTGALPHNLYVTVVSRH